MQLRCWCSSKKEANRALWWQTYTCNLSGGEDAAQQEHLDGDCEDEDEGESQRRLGRHDCPQNPQTHQLDAGEQMHTQRTNLQDTECLQIMYINVNVISCSQTLSYIPLIKS